MKHRAQSLTSLGIVVLALTSAAPQAKGPVIVVPPAVPSNLTVPAGHKPFLMAHAVGTQNYVCLANGAAYSWAFFGPQATLFDASGNQQITHFLSANPVENGVLRPTWQHSGDTSAAWAAHPRSTAVQGPPARFAS
jgi:hypothetical protein